MVLLLCAALYKRLVHCQSSELVSSGKAIVMFSFANVYVRKSGLPHEGCMEWPMGQEHR